MEDGLTDETLGGAVTGTMQGPIVQRRLFSCSKPVATQGVGEGTQDFPSINSVTSFTFNMILKQKSKEFHQEHVEKPKGLFLGSKPIRTIHAHYKLTSY